ncbi:serine hydrolase domain-containing protein [Shimia thalassica]|uniref:serine hydrolase domain-containing protein n=1 Tax=Shimia thalassica TaxID=1715693 RepID=UPI002736E6D0|nr:serine hydrolase domain-containing protein [Shimia thalassica]MDP2492806.1 serine hydrolase domain-containing protein [Shimia thalassica]
MTLAKFCTSCLSLLLCGLFAFDVDAADMQRAQKVEAAWQNWAQENGVTQGAFTVSFKGETLITSGISGNGQRPFEIASLSKSITATCVALLVDAGKLGYKDTVGELLGARIPNMHPEAQSITVAQLLTHSSGFKPDATQAAMAQWYGTQDMRHWQASRTALARAPRRSGKFRYNNENYAILGAIVEVVTDATYLKTCKSRTGLPTARLSSRVGGNAAWGGWEMPVAEFARFHARHYGLQSSFAQRPGAYPSVNVGGGIRYALGMSHRTSNGQSSFWHFGSYCFPDRMNTGAYAVTWFTGWAVTVAYNRCLEEKDMLSLDAALIKAAFR